MNNNSPGNLSVINTGFKMATGTEYFKIIRVTIHFIPVFVMDNKTENTGGRSSASFALVPSLPPDPEADNLPVVRIFFIVLHRYIF